MKKLIALIAVLAYVPGAFADGAEFTHDGEFRLRYQSTAANESVGAASDGVAMQRFKWGTTFCALNDWFDRQPQGAMTINFFFTGFLFSYFSSSTGQT